MAGIIVIITVKKTNSEMQHLAFLIVSNYLFSLFRRYSNETATG